MKIQDLKLIDHDSAYHPGYDAGEGCIITYTYVCPCGNGTAKRIKDDIPGYKDNFYSLDCKECNEKYDLQLNGGLFKK